MGTARSATDLRTVCLLLALACAAPADVAAPQSGTLRVPPGFRVALFAEGLRAPRGLAVGPDGALYAALMGDGRVVRLPDADGDGRADRVETVLSDLDRPHALAWFREHLWVAEPTRILRVTDYRPGGPEARRFEIVVDGLTDGRGHFTRTLAFDPSGAYLYVAVGSSCNLCVERDPRRATILRMRPDGSGAEIFATGLRNPVGLAFHPVTGELWTTVNERDWLGDDEPPDRLDIVRQGRDYGWPYCNATGRANPEYRAEAGRCARAERPAWTFPAHSAPLGVAFYEGAAFPGEYRGDAFVALHGSWNRSTRIGYKVVRVRVRDGRPVGAEDFVTGWLTPDGRVWGRPVDVKVGADGALYVSDDGGDRVWRVSTEGGGNRP
jgi:glucose/arabinose dehydrogenase